MNRSRLWSISALVSLSVIACGEADEPVVREPVAEESDSALEGMSPSEIRMLAEPMSPEVAESLGIVDTTIHLEDRSTGDTIPDFTGQDSAR